MTEENGGGPFRVRPPWSREERAGLMERLRSYAERHGVELPEHPSVADSAEEEKRRRLKAREDAALQMQEWPPREDHMPSAARLLAELIAIGWRPPYTASPLPPPDFRLSIGPNGVTSNWEPPGPRGSFVRWDQMTPEQQERARREGAAVMGVDFAAEAGGGSAEFFFVEHEELLTGHVPYKPPMCGWSTAAEAVDWDSKATATPVEDIKRLAEEASRPLQASDEIRHLPRAPNVMDTIHGDHEYIKRTDAQTGAVRLRVRETEGEVEVEYDRSKYRIEPVRERCAEGKEVFRIVRK